MVMQILIQLGHDPISLGLLIAINLQTSFLTPPFGGSLLHPVWTTPKDVTAGHIYAGVIPCT